MDICKEKCIPIYRRHNSLILAEWLHTSQMQGKRCKGKRENIEDRRQRGRREEDRRKEKRKKEGKRKIKKIGKR